MHTLTRCLLIAGLLPVLAYGAGSAIAVGDLATTTQGAAVPVQVLNNDVGFAYPATVTLLTPPGHGGVIISGSPGAPGAVVATYTPTAGFEGTDTFVYKVSDGTSTGSATVTVTVLADSDGDGIADIRDNCINVPNGPLHPDSGGHTQLDADGDGYGNACDADLNNSGLVTVADYGLLRSVLGQSATASPTAAAADLNGSGTVTTADYGILRSFLGEPPGPSAFRAVLPDGSTVGFTVGGSISGLQGSGLVLQNNGEETLSAPANGPFVFHTALASGAAYRVTVLTQPSNPSQSCSVTGGIGNLGIGSLPNVLVSCTTISATAPFGHVVIVVEENANYSSVIGNSAMPYLASLISTYGLATQYYADTHPSIGNYMMLVTGQVLTNDDDQTPASFPVAVDNVVRQLVAHGKTWKAYSEGLPSVGYTGGDTGGYAVRHAPLAYLTDVQNSASEKLNLVPFTQFATDLASGQLPNYSFVTPNLCNDAHDCGLDVADTWLQTNIAPLLASAPFRDDGLLIVVFDESGSDNTHGGGLVVAVVVSPAFSRLGCQSTSFYQHESTLRLMLEGLGIKSLPGAAATAPPMWEFFNFPPPP
jgi:acid phosphatase